MLPRLVWGIVAGFVRQQREEAAIRRRLRVYVTPREGAAQG